MGCIPSKRAASRYTQAAKLLSLRKSDSKIQVVSKMLSLLTWNTSNATASSSAPRGWGRADQEHGIAKLVLGLAPDVVCLQELQGSGISDQLSGSYRLFGQAVSHCGFCTTFVRKDSGIAIATTTAAPGEATPVTTVGPATLLRLVLPSGHSVRIANCHLEPFKDGAAKRLQQLKAIVDQHAASSGDPHAAHQGAAACQHSSAPLLVIAGDMNMRQDEDEAATQGLGLQDAWELAGSQMATKNTWDTRRNLYYKDGFKYNARYDRIYVRGAVPVGCSAFQLVGHEPLNPGHYLSDHFGILATLHLPDSLAAQPPDADMS